MKLDSFFEKIYCINLKARADRWTACKAEFRKQGIEKVTRFEGVPGIPAGFTVHGAMDVKPDDSNYEKKLAGRVGCLLSHLAIIKTAKKQKRKCILILEDDIQFVQDVQEKFSAMIDQLPENWAILYLGGNEKGVQAKVASNVFTTSDMLMAHAIGINQVVYDEAIQLLSECMHPVDVYYTWLQKKYPSFVLYPYLAWQRAGWSDIEQRFRIYDLEYSSPSLDKMLQCKPKE